MIKPTFTELLAPARDLEAATAAIDFGADAIYMGAARFGARHAAGNAVGDIARAVDYARRYRVRVYATLNTVLFDNELDEARQQALDIIDAGVDALIVQDMAYMEMGLTGVEMHASTQMFNAAPEKVLFLEKAGFSRVILERNLTLNQIREIRRATSVELEAFVHGAICVCHSGRCYMSRSMGPRSGNRGECAQPCRLAYDLFDPSGNRLLAGKHLLSVQDLDLSVRIGDLLDAGVRSFKIEGRLKEPNYVKNTVASYRRRIDDQMAARPGLCRASDGRSVYDFTPDLSKSFSRGRTEYFIGGTHRTVASLDTPKAIGERMGQATAAGKGWFSTGDVHDFAPGDGVCFFADGGFTGANVNRIEGGKVMISKHVRPDPDSVIFRNYDHRYNTAVNSSRTRRVIDAAAEVEASAERISLTLHDVEGFEATSAAEGPFEAAFNSEKAAQTMRSQTAKSGDTIFSVNTININTTGPVPFVPASVLNTVRREGLERLLRERLCAPPRRTIVAPDSAAPYPADHVDGTENVTNHLSRRFYEKHGVKEIEHGLELLPELKGRTVMRTPYCIRRELGRCTKGRPQENCDLLLRHGPHTYRLRFRCSECMMEVVSEK